MINVHLEFRKCRKINWKSVCWNIAGAGPRQGNSFNRRKMSISEEFSKEKKSCIKWAYRIIDFFSALPCNLYIFYRLGIFGLKRNWVLTEQWPKRNGMTPRKMPLRTWATSSDFIKWLIPIKRRGQFPCIFTAPRFKIVRQVLQISKSNPLTS